MSRMWGFRCIHVKQQILGDEQIASCDVIRCLLPRNLGVWWLTNHKFQPECEENGCTGLQRSNGICETPVRGHFYLSLVFTSPIFFKGTWKGESERQIGTEVQLE